MTVIRFTIPLPPRTKKNGSRIFGKRLLPSKAFEQYQRDAAAFMPRGVHIDKPVNICAVFYTDTRRRVDQSNLIAALDDILTHYGVIADDCRDIVAGHDGSRVYHDKHNPRTEVTITEVEGYERWDAKGKTT